MEIRASDLARMADELLGQYDLIGAYGSFHWQDEGLPAAADRRLTLQQKTSALPPSRDDRCLLKHPDDVYRWGFNKPLPSKFRNESFLGSLSLLLSAWRKPGLKPEDRATKVGALCELMTFKGLKIATASKFVCFIDQSTYGIYDSRVSVALSQLEIGGQRAFPIVGRRVPNGKRGWAASAGTSDPARTASRYWDYLRFLGVVVSKIDQLRSQVELGRQFNAAEVEMALFMLGDVWR